MHILLLILKIIGIVLLVLLGIVLLLAALLLFVPFCYRAEGSYYDDDPYGMVRIRYLFPLLQVKVQYKNGEAEGKVKLFGFTVYDLLAPRENAVKNEKPSPKKAKTEPQVTPAEESEDVEVSENIKPEEAIETLPEDEPDLSLKYKIQHFISVIKDKIASVFKKLKNLRETALQYKKKTEDFINKLKWYYEIWQKDYTQRAFQKAKTTLYKLWKSVRPKKGNVSLRFGTGDPASTGQMCGYFGMLYPFLGKYVMIEPDFENKIYEGDFYFKGYITVVSFLRVVWIALFDKDIKRLRKILTKQNKEESYE